MPAAAPPAPAPSTGSPAASRLAMEAMIRQDEAAPGDTALLIAFGAGLSYAGQVVTLPPLG